jgi:hypothetical protein
MVKKSAPGKGPAAEEALANYFRAAGFFAVRGLPFRHEGEDLTDVDVWLYERGSGLGRRRFIVDSKNRKSPKVVERLFWIGGLQRAIGLDGGFVATTAARMWTLQRLYAQDRREVLNRSCRDRRRQSGMLKFATLLAATKSR